MGHGVDIIYDFGLRIADLRSRRQESEARIQEKDNRNLVILNYLLLTPSVWCLVPSS